MPHTTSALRRRLDRAAERITPPINPLVARRKAFEREWAYLEQHPDIDRELVGLIHAHLRVTTCGPDDGTGPGPHIIETRTADELQARIDAIYDHVKRAVGTWQEGWASL